MDQRLTIKSCNFKSCRKLKHKLEENIDINSMTLDWEWFLRYDINAASNKTKIDKLNFIKIRLSFIKGQYQESEKTIHRIVF